MHPDLKIKIPKRTPADHERAKSYWDLVRAHGKSRKAMVDFICNIGGYSTRGDSFAIEFNIKAYLADLDKDHLWWMLCSGKMDVGPASDWPPEKTAQAMSLFYKAHKEHEDDLWNWGVEEAYESWRDSDTPYETFAGERIEWKWEVHGRGAGHLCMTECEGYSLKGDPEDLRETLMCKDGGDWDIPHSQVRKLFIICVQNTVDLTPRNIADEVEYRAAWRLWVSFVENELDEAVKEDAEVKALTQAAKHIHECLSQDFEDDDKVMAGFKAICTRAGITLGE